MASRASGCANGDCWAVTNATADLSAVPLTLNSARAMANCGCGEAVLLQLSSPGKQHLRRPAAADGCEQADLSSHRLIPGCQLGTSTATLHCGSAWQSLQHASCVRSVALPLIFLKSSLMQSSPSLNAQPPGGAGAAGGAGGAQIGCASFARSLGTNSGDTVRPARRRHTHRVRKSESRASRESEGSTAALPPRLGGRRRSGRGA